MTEASPDRDIAAAAALWHDRVLAGGLGKARQAEVQRWLAADPAHAESFRRIEATHAALEAVADAPEILALRHETLTRVALRRKQRWRYAAAAGVAAVVIGGGGLALSPALRNLVHAPAQAVTSSVYETGPGERTTVVLPDGSTAELDARSRLRATYTSDVRQLRLEAGQALFEVMKDPRRPFAVHAGGQTITAHGTRFNVGLAEDRLEVALLEGRIGVVSDETGRGAEMAPHDLLRIDRGVQTLERVQNIERFTSWRQGLVMLDNTRLGDAVAEINRYSHQQIRLAEPRLKELRLSGAFRVEQTQAFVEALQLYFALKVVARSPDEITLAARGD